MILKLIILIIEIAILLIVFGRLLKINDYLKKFPDGFKEQYMKELRLLTIACFISAIFIAISILSIATNSYYFFVALSIFLSSHILISMFEEFQDLSSDVE